MPSISLHKIVEMMKPIYLATLFYYIYAVHILYKAPQSCQDEAPYKLIHSNDKNSIRDAISHSLQKYHEMYIRCDQYQDLQTFRTAQVM